MLDEEEGTGSQDLLRYVFVVLHRWWLVVLFMGAGTAAALYHQSKKPQVYVASASVLVRVEAPKVLGQKADEAAVAFGDNQWSADRATFYNSQLSIMRSEAVAELSVRQGKLADMPAIAGVGTEAQRFATAVRSVQSSISVTLAEQERTVWVNAMHSDPAAAAAIANAVIAGYEAFNLDSYRSGNAHATEWLAKELDDVETELNRTNTEIMDFKKDNGLLAFSLEDRRSLLANDIAHYSEAATAAKTQRLVLEAENKKISEAAEQGDIAQSPIFDVASSVTGRLLREQLLAATIELDSLSVTLGPQHPTRLAQLERVQKSKQALADEAKLVLAVSTSGLKKALAVEGRLESELESLKAQAFELGPKEIFYSGLLRKRDEAETRAKHLRERFNETDMAGRLQASNLRPLDPAVAVPAANKSLRYAAAGGALLGMLLSIGLILGAYQLDSSIKTVAEVEALGAEEFLGALPAMGKDGSEVGRFQEAARIVRTNMSFLSPDSDYRTIMVTSPQPRDGKSTTAYWMAASLAQTGKRVLLIDCDMRNPSLHKRIDAPRTEGLSELIVGSISVEKAIRHTEEKGVYLLPAGCPIRNPSESLASKRFANLLETLRGQYDILILDTPPILPVTDASIVCGLADLVLMIARCGNTERTALHVALTQIRRASPKVLGMIANYAGGGTSGYYYKGYSAKYSYGEDFDADAEPAIGLDPAS